jgi:hypothetical protein
MAELLAMPQQSFDRPLTVGPLKAACIRAASRLGFNESELAAALGGLHPSQWAKQKAGAEGHRMSVERFDELKPAYRDLFLDALIDELARTRGKVVASPAGQFAAMARTARAMADIAEQMAVAAQPTLPLVEKVGA